MMFLEEDTPLVLHYQCEVGPVFGFAQGDGLWSDMYYALERGYNNALDFAASDTGKMVWSLYKNHLAPIVKEVANETLGEEETEVLESILKTLGTYITVEGEKRKSPPAGKGKKPAKKTPALFNDEPPTQTFSDLDISQYFTRTGKGMTAKKFKPGVVDEKKLLSDLIASFAN